MSAETADAAEPTARREGGGRSKLADLPAWAKIAGGSGGGVILAAWMWASQLSAQVSTVQASTKDLPALLTRVADLEKARAAEDARQLDLARRLDRMETTADRILVRLESISDRLQK